MQGQNLAYTFIITCNYKFWQKVKEDTLKMSVKIVATLCPASTFHHFENLTTVHVDTEDGFIRRWTHRQWSDAGLQARRSIPLHGFLFFFTITLWKFDKIALDFFLPGFTSPIWSQEASAHLMRLLLSPLANPSSGPREETPQSPSGLTRRYHSDTSPVWWLQVIFYCK